MDDEKLIQLVRMYPELYDVSNPKYMHYPAKMKIWNDIATELKMTVSNCKIRWNNIRDNYRKSLKRIAVPTNPKKITKSYKYARQLEFLLNSFDDKNIKPKERSEYNSDTDLEQRNDSIQDENEDSFDSKNELNTMEKDFIRKRRRLQDMKNDGSSSIAIDAFLAGIAPTLKSLDPYNLNLAKSDIFSAVQKYEMKMLQERYEREDNYVYDDSNHSGSPNLNQMKFITEIKCENEVTD